MKRRTFLTVTAGFLASSFGPALAPPVLAAPVAIASIDASTVILQAKRYLGLPYKYGGTDPTRALDCSAYVSLAWGIPRQTTDTIGGWATRISKAELLPGDAMNLADDGRADHIRLFDGWATADRTIMWVYEAAWGFGVSHHVVGYDDRYQPIRRLGFTPDLPLPSPVMPVDYDLPRGHFFSQTGGNDGRTGFAVTNENRINLWSEFRRLGGVDGLGWPLSSRFASWGLTVQVFEKGVLAWDPLQRSATVGPLPDDLILAVAADALTPVETPLLARPQPRSLGQGRAP